jgi:adenylate cyclase
MDIAEEPTWPQFRSRALSWLVGPARAKMFIDHVLPEVCALLREEGLPLERVTAHLRILHPQFYGARMLWRPGLEEAEVNLVDYDVIDDPRFAHNPIRALYDGAEGIRQRLDLGIDGAMEYGIYDDLRADGFTDYLAVPMVFTDGRRHAMTFATTRPGGFVKADIQRIHDILPLLAMAFEIRANRRMTRNLLNTYVGTSAGKRVLAGQITRGSGTTVSAAIWHCDMRSFTAISERWPRDDVLSRLNEYFDAMGGPVERHGGEILKFIGDGMLAIFPLEDEAACNRALIAAYEARREIESLNRRYAEIGREPLGYGLALHVGDVMYGNIGTVSRLDFTVIGPAVNTAARLEGLTKELGRRVLLSGPFAMRCGCSAEMLTALGRYPLRGVGEPLEVFGLADDR